MTKRQPGELVAVTADGEIDLWGGPNVGPYGAFTVTVKGDDKGTSFGNPEQVRRVLRSALEDGSASVVERHDNRAEFTLALWANAADGVALAGAEAALFELEKRRWELRWTPLAKDGKPAVFVVVSAQLKQVTDQHAEGRLIRHYTLAIEALPFAFSLTPFTLTALAVGSSTPTLVDDCASLTGWTAAGATLTLSSGGSTIKATPAASGAAYTVTRTGVVDLTTDKYLTVLGSSSSTFMPDKVEVLTTPGSWVTVAAVGTDGSALVYDTSVSPDPTIEAVRFTFRNTVFLDRIQKQAAPRSTASRQQVRVLPVPGSARTPGSLLVESPTTGLGTVIVYSGPGYDPSLSRRSVDARTTDATTISGSRRLLANGASESFHVPVSELPQGDHSIWARILPSDAQAAGTVAVSLQLLDATGADLTPAETVGSVRVSWTGAAYAFFVLGATSLPFVALPPDSTALLKITLTWTADVSAHSITIDEAWAFNRSHGALTIVKAAANRKVWLDAATLDRDHPAVFLGSGDKSAARAANLTGELVAWPGTHSMEPPVVHVYTASDTAPDARVSGSGRAAWHTHPAA